MFSVYLVDDDTLILEELINMVPWLDNGFEVVSRWAMGSSLEEIARSAEADVNLVVSAAGLGAAEVLYEKFRIPYIVGVPVGDKPEGQSPKVFLANGAQCHVHVGDARL